jgi:hypothetical protein
MNQIPYICEWPGRHRIASAVSLAIYGRAEPLQQANILYPNAMFDGEKDST